MKNMEVELGTVRSVEDTDRFVYYRPKSKNMFIRLCGGFLYTAYRTSPGFRWEFEPQEYSALKERIKTLDDVREWKREQRAINRENKRRNESNWEEAENS